MSMRVMLFFAVCSVFIGCVNTYDRFESYHQIVTLDQEYSLSSISCDIEKLDTLATQQVLLVKFRRAQGGANYLFGFIKINEFNMNEYKRLNVIDKDSIVVKSFSISDFKELGKDTVDLNNLR